MRRAQRFGVPVYGCVGQPVGVFVLAGGVQVLHQVDRASERVRVVGAQDPLERRVGRLEQLHGRRLVAVSAQVVGVGSGRGQCVRMLGP